MRAPPSRQRDYAFFRIRILPVKQCGVSDDPDAHAATLIGDLRAMDGALVAIRAEEAQLHEFTRSEEFLQFRKNSDVSPPRPTFRLASSFWPSPRKCDF